MSFFKDNLSWIVPTGAIVMCTAFLAGFGILDRSSDDSVGVNDTIAAVQTQAETAQSVDPLSNFSTQSLITTPIDNVSPQSEADSLQIINALKQATMNIKQNEVTRNEPLSLLDTSAADAGPIAVAQPVKTGSAAAFFDTAQANLAANDTCGDDLKALVENTRIYFPAGGLTAEDSGLIKARIIGQVADRCAGYTLEVQGHSDPSGDKGVNLRLSKKRAEAVIARLASGGIDTSGFVAVGLGDQQPSNITGPRDSAYYDRRVEFAIVKNSPTTRAAGFTLPGQSPISTCAAQLTTKVEQIRLFYGARAVTVSPSELEGIYELAQAVTNCEGARLRVIGQHTDQIGSQESIDTGRLRALVLMGSLVSAGFDSERIIVSAPSYSVAVAGQPSLPKSRVDFQIITD